METCNLCGKVATSRCKGCGHVVYCSREHQQVDWKTHKHACREFNKLKQKGQEWEGDVKQGTSEQLTIIGEKLSSH